MAEQEFAPESSGSGHAVPPGAIDARVHNVSGGQIAVGNRVIQISAEHGSVVVAGDEEPLVVTPRPTPVMRGLRPPRTIIGRDRELTRIHASLEQGISVEVAGPPGVGRTTVLSAVSAAPLPAFAPQGVVAVPAGLPGDDILQFVFDACFERSHRVKPTPEELRRYLGNLRILVILDDPDLDRQQTERVLAALPSAVFVMGVAEPMLLLGDTAVTLGGLAQDAAVGLLEAAIGRPLDPDEMQAAGRLAEGLHGIPLQLLQLAAVIRDQGLSLRTLADDIAPTVENPQAALQAAATEGLGDRERSVQVSLAAFGGVAVATGLLAKYAAEPDAGTILRRLVGRGLARGDDLTGWAPIDLDAADDDDRVRAAPVLVEWITDVGRQPEEVADQSPVVLSVIHQELSAGRHDPVIRLAAVAEGMLALAGHWATWHQVLEAGLGAATAAGDEVSAAFFEHQLDIRAQTLQPTTQAQEHLARGMQEPDTLYRSEPPDVQRLYRESTTPGGLPHGAEIRETTGRQWPFLIGVGIVVLAVLGMLVYLVGRNDPVTDRTGGQPGTSSTPTPVEGNGSKPLQPDVSVSVEPGGLIHGDGTARVSVSNLQGTSQGGVLRIAVEGGATIEACGDGGSSSVTCPIDALSSGQTKSVSVAFHTNSDSVTVTAEFDPTVDEKDSDPGNNTDSATIVDTQSSAPDGSPTDTAPDGQPTDTAPDGQQDTSTPDDGSETLTPNLQ